MGGDLGGGGVEVAGRWVGEMGVGLDDGADAAGVAVADGEVDGVVVEVEAMAAASWQSLMTRRGEGELRA